MVPFRQFYYSSSTETLNYQKEFSTKMGYHPNFGEIRFTTGHTRFSSDVRIIYNYLFSFATSNRYLPVSEILVRCHFRYANLQGNLIDSHFLFSIISFGENSFLFCLLGHSLPSTSFSVSRPCRFQTSPCSFSN